MADRFDEMARVTLEDCPIGLFMYGTELCLKTEYGNNEGRIDAFIVSSGEFFWGDAPQTIASQRKQMVAPFDMDTALAAEREAGAADMRERAAHAAAICRSTLPADADPLQTAEIVQGDIVRHIYDLPLTTPKET